MNNDKANSNYSKKALVIAVSEYDTFSGLKSIEFCKNDGQEMYNVLKKNGYDIPDNRKLIGYVDAQRLKKTIYDFFTNKDNKPDDTLVFYYSGHGVPDKWAKTFLAPSDMDSDHPRMTGFSFDDLTDSMLECNSLRIVTILDSCFSGSLKISKGLGLDSKSGEEATTRIANSSIEEKSNKLKQGVGRCLLAASQGYEEAYDRLEKDHSIFTYYLLEGLKGHKNAVDDEGNVTYDTLGNFITREIGNLPPEKRPKQTPVKKGEVAGGEIILANYPELRRTKESDYYVLFGKGEDYYHLGKYQEALECFDSILKLQPNNERALIRKGNILVQLNDDKKALECFDQVISLNKTNLDAWYYKAQLNIKNRDYENALKCLDEASNINPDDERIWDGYKKVKSIMRLSREKEKQEEAVLSPAKIQKTDVSVIDTLTDKPHYPSKGSIYEEAQLKPTEEIAEQAIEKEDKEKRKYAETDSNNKPRQGIFGSYSKPIEERKKIDVTNTNIITPPPSSIKSDTEKPQQKKDTDNYIPNEVQIPKSPFGLKIILPIIGIIAAILVVVIVFVIPFGSDTPPDNIVPGSLPPNSLPKASHKEVTTSFNSPVDITLEATDENVDDKLTATIVTQPQHGSLGEIDQTSKTVTYTPDQDFEGTDTFTYKVNDGTADSNTAIVTVTVSGPPNVLSKASHKEVTTSFNSPVDITLEATDENVDDKLTATIVKPPQHGTLGAIVQTSKTVIYTPDQDFEGTDTFTYKVNDGTGTADSNTVIVTVAVSGPPSGPPNVLPKALGKSVIIAFNSPTEITLEATDENVDDKLTATIVKPPQHGTLGAIVQTSKTVIYTPDQDFEGTDTFTYKVNDGTADSNTAIVTVTVSGPPNVLPKASDKSVTTSNHLLPAFVIGNKEDGQFDNPIDIAVDSNDNVYVVDSGNNRIQKFDSNGNFITEWGNQGTGEGQFYHPSGIDIDSKNNVYVADSDNDRIQKFAPII